MWAAPGASILAGVRPGVDRSALRTAFRAGAYDDVLLRHPVAAGDTVLVPGGVLHGFGPDTLIVEVQQTSDLSESVMPDDVFGRPLAPEAWTGGLERALDIATSAVRPVPDAGVVVASGALRRTVGCRSERFVLERWALEGEVAAAPGEGGFATLTNLGDAVDLEHEGGVVALPRAASCLLPAALGEVRLRPRGTGDLVVCYEPKARTGR